MNNDMINKISFFLFIANIILSSINLNWLAALAWLAGVLALCQSIDDWSFLNIKNWLKKKKIIKPKYQVGDRIYFSGPVYYEDSAEILEAKSAVHPCVPYYKVRAVKHKDHHGKYMELSIPESCITGKESRCCGRCDGVNDICVADMICDDHRETGCRICWP